MNRLDDITRATDNLDRCVRERGKLTAQGDRWGVTLGEMDWLQELHRLLYEENTLLTAQEQREMSHIAVAEEIDGRQIARDAIAAAQRAHSAAKGAAFGMGGPELTVGPNPNTEPTPQVTARYLAEKGLPYDRAGIVEDACKAFARNKISGNEFERRIEEVRARLDLVPDSLDPRRDPVKVWAAPEKTEAIRSAARPGIGGAPTRATTLPESPAERKKYPVASGFMDYFPDAIAAVANLSYIGNEQHNPGQPLNWARGKSTDEADTMMRHFLQRGTLDTDGVRHSVKMVWRALAFLQKEIEAETPAQR